MDSKLSCFSLQYICFEALSLFSKRGWGAPWHYKSSFWELQFTCDITVLDLVPHTRTVCQAKPVPAPSAARRVSRTIHFWSGEAERSRGSPACHRRAEAERKTLHWRSAAELYLTGSSFDSVFESTKETEPLLFVWFCFLLLHLSFLFEVIFSFDFSGSYLNTSPVNTFYPNIDPPTDAF